MNFGIGTARGRGYRPEQVDRFLDELSEDRDAAWERAARLTVLANEMDAECRALREAVATLAPPSYDTLGPRAQELMRLVEDEAAAVRGRAEAETRYAHDTAEAARLALLDEARAAAQARLAAAEEHVQHVIGEARAGAAALRADAEREAAHVRGEAQRTIEAVRHDSERTLAELDKEYRERLDAHHHEFAEREAGIDSRVGELSAYAENLTGEAERTLSTANAEARHRQDDAEAAASELLAQARVREERIRREAERELREHEVRREEIREHLAHVRSTLAALTGREPGEEADAHPDTATDPDPGKVTGADTATDTDATEAG
jgi:cell division septum initiation protein DivIVA